MKDEEKDVVEVLEYVCPFCNQVSGVIHDVPLDHGYEDMQLFCCEHCDSHSEVWIISAELASKFRRMIKERLKADQETTAPDASTSEGRQNR